MERSKETQVHVLVACSDARDHVPVHGDSIRAVRANYLDRGIDLRFEVLRVPGAFITSDVVADIRRIFDTVHRDPVTAGKPIGYSVYIQTHGALEWDSDDTNVLATADMRVVKGSPVNCGMLGATEVGLELERLLVANKVEVEVGGRTLRVEDEAGIRAFLSEVYGYDGHMAGDWIRSLDDLRTHPRTQKLRLERAMWRDPDLRSLGVRIFGGIQDYMRRRHVRVVTGEGDAPFWDELFTEVHQRSAGLEHDPHEAPKQKPLVGLLSMSDLYSPKRRDDVAAWYARREGIEGIEHRLYNVFAIGGNSFDIVHSRFGRYIIAGFYYSAKALGVTNYVVLGTDEFQTNRMLEKIANDPLMKLVVDSCGVTFIPITVADLDGTS